MDKGTIANRITEWRSVSVRGFGRPKLRGEDDVREDVGTMRIKNWSKLALGRTAQKRIVEQDKVRKEF
jgi:hypothetical protein